MAAESARSWPDVAKIVIWPVFALIIIAIFFAPISGLLRNTIDSKMALQELELGSLKIKLSPTGLARLPTPDPAMAEKLARLDGGDIESLIQWDPDILSTHLCLRPPAVGDRAWGDLTRDWQAQQVAAAARNRKLIDLQFLLAADHEEGTIVNYCENGEPGDVVKITSAGKDAREFLLKLTANAIQLEAK